jgi:ATP-dependent helicase HrpA
LYRLEQANSGNRGAINFLKNIRVELSRLVPETFVDRYDTDQMVHIERYIQALTIRAQKGVLNFEKDQARASELQPYTDKLEELLKTLSPSVSDEKKKAIEAYFWLIEEYKVSLFAQELKTALPVSKKRLNQKLKEIDRMI